MPKPQILLTNDDGIRSPGLWAAAASLSELGYVTVTAPRDQSSGMGRSLPNTSDGIIHLALVVLLGAKKAARLHPPAIVLAYGSLPFLVLLGLPPAAANAYLLLAPLAAWLAWRMGRRAWADPAQWNSLGFWSIGLLMTSVGAELLAFLWLFLA